MSIFTYFRITLHYLTIHYHSIIIKLCISVLIQLCDIFCVDCLKKKASCSPSPTSLLWLLTNCPLICLHPIFPLYRIKSLWWDWILSNLLPTSRSHGIYLMAQISQINSYWPCSSNQARRKHRAPQGHCLHQLIRY